MKFVCQLCLILLPTVVSAFSPQPGFDLIRSATSSELIVAGQLSDDGMFDVSEVLKGKGHEPSRMKLENIGWISEHLAKPLKLTKAPELVLFLKEPDSRGLYAVSNTSLVAFDESGDAWAWLTDDGLSMVGHSLKKYSPASRNQLVLLIREKLATAQHLQEIIDLPRSPQRAARLVQFLRDNEPDIVRPYEGWLNGIMGYQSYYIEKIAAALTKVSEEEAFTLLGAVEKAEDDQGKAIFLQVLCNSPCPKKLFGQLKRWTERNCGRLTRVTAFAALIRCDYDLGVAALIPMLQPEEPQLRDVLSAIRGVWPWRTRWPETLVAPVRELGEELLKIRSGSDSNEDTNRGYAILGDLSYFSHPSFVPVVLAWATSDKSNSAQATSSLVRMLGFQHGKDSLKKMSDWIADNRDALIKQYDLEKKPLEWMRAFKVADEHLKPLLLRLWQFEDHVDESGLMIETTGEHSEQAKTVLAHLWQTKLLSRSTQQEIAQRFVSFSLEERVNLNGSKMPLLCLIETRDFEFPDSAWALVSEGLLYNESCIIKKALQLQSA